MAQISSILDFKLSFRGYSLHSRVFKVKCSIALRLNANIIRRPIKKTRNNTENQWLLANKQTEGAVYGSTPINQNEIKSGNIVTKERQHKRLEE
ncbi:hypothetical protein AOQ84DRAFT_374810 [Glonium stellatum]|uniref:Uncharacterized protein n=1 Tax=Glonium stellatum TaxID=574774 RepID=A0A8E2F596_9PEZI|nr:hypothetical protein AOQ84DRAFT_374810 [Glonium stellatum]